MLAVMIVWRKGFGQGFDSVVLQCLWMQIVSMWTEAQTLETDCILNLQVPYVRVAHGFSILSLFLQFFDVLDDVVLGQERSRNAPPKKHVVIRMDARPVSGPTGLIFGARPSENFSWVRYGKSCSRLCFFVIRWKSDSQSPILPFASGIRRGCPCQRGVGAWTWSMWNDILWQQRQLSGFLRLARCRQSLSLTGFQNEPVFLTRLCLSSCIFFRGSISAVLKSPGEKSKSRFGTSSIVASHWFGRNAGEFIAITAITFTSAPPNSVAITAITLNRGHHDLPPKLFQ